MTKSPNRVLSVLFFLSVLWLTACNSDVVYTNAVPMSEEIWKVQDVPEFNVTVKDTLNSNNVFFTIRTGSAYPFRNIYLFVTTASPDGRRITDTLQYNLADEKGVWFGKGFGDIHELKLPYKTNVYFPVTGAYIFRIQHGMRILDLKGVYDVGMRIEKTSK